MLTQGDCLEVMAEWPDNSVDSIVTDPPYGLSAQPDMEEVLRHWLAGDDYQHRGGGFMGKSWDSFVPGPKVWAECLRVLKPGGHLLAFFGTRTYDLGALSIRLAGFEVRDTLAYCYGSGFPKSLNVSKAMDKAAGAERKVIGHTDPHDPRTAMARKMYGTDLQDEPGQGTPITEAATAEAAQWEGWGTALKPAYEPIVLARKPLTGTVAETVIEHGTGAMNIDGCRIGTEKILTTNGRGFAGSFQGGTNNQGGKETEGRWPANLILDEEAGALLDEQSGDRPGGNYPAQRGEGVATGFGAGLPTEGGPRSMNDSGGASRFFYCPKANSREKNAGLGEQFEAAGHFHEKGIQPQKNSHPTVKPIDLMRWLCRLITPPGGTVVDPFAGSGTTGIAAHLEGFDFHGIEQDEEYLRIAEARLKWWSQYSGETADILKGSGSPRKEQRDGLAPTLFDS